MFYNMPFSDRPRFCRLMKTRKVRYPDRLGWTRTKPEDQEGFYFPDASQISAMVGDSVFKVLQLGTSASVGDGFRSLPIPLFAGLQSRYFK